MKQSSADSVEPVGLDKVRTSTRLLGKNYSPLIVRKYQTHGWPMYIGLICDISLSDLDDVVGEFEKGFEIEDDIQSVRNFCGALSETLVEHYNAKKHKCVEGVIVCWYVDKMFCSSAYGDFMTHNKCAMEFYQILNTLPHI